MSDLPQQSAFPNGPVNPYAGPPMPPGTPPPPPGMPPVGFPPPGMPPVGFPPPGVPGGAPVASGLAMKRRHPVAVWLGLPLITLGIYSLVWYYKVHREMRDFDRRRSINPAGSLLTIMFGWIVIVPPYVSYYNTGDRIRNTQRAAGLQPTCSPVVGLLLMLVFGLGTLYYQSELNKVVERYPGAAPGVMVPLFA